MIGRPPKMNWTASRNQYTCTINGTLHRLGTDEAAAEKQFDFLVMKYDAGEVPERNPTFGYVADAWLTHIEPIHDVERFRLCKSRINEFIKYLGKDIYVRDLRAHHVEDWIKSKTTTKADGTKRGYKAIILACLNYAAGSQVRIIAKNPLKGKLVMPEGGSRGGEAVWTPEIFDLVLANVNERFGDFLKMLAWTGARPSTIRRVCARHYRPDLKLWDLQDLSLGKQSKKRVKRVWLPPQAIEMVERLNKVHPEGPIFRNTVDKPICIDTPTNMIFKLRLRLRKAGTPLPKGITIYGLRHTFCTNFIVQHPDKLEYLRELLGHSDLTMIRKHYGHLFDQHSAMHSVLSNLKTLG